MKLIMYIVIGRKGMNINFRICDQRVTQLNLLKNIVYQLLMYAS
jgi:hypothetical protein